MIDTPFGFNIVPSKVGVKYLLGLHISCQIMTSKYVNTSFVVVTPSVRERLFSVAEFTIADSRKGVLRCIRGRLILSHSYVYMSTFN